MKGFPIITATILSLNVLVNSTLVLAQTDTSSAATLSEVVITGQYTPQSVKQSVYQVRVISKEQIQRQAPASLQNILNIQLNIRFSQDVATGGANITMLGLSGQNVKILIDGVPVTGRQGTSNEININQLEINSIERIEIIEGPMSVMYGADALAGVINIITKKNGTYKLGINARILEETVGKEYGIRKGIHNQYIGVSAAYKSWYFNGGVGRNLFNGWKDSATGRELLWHKKDQITANAIVGYRTDKLHVYYRLDGLDEIITNPANPTGTEPAIDQEYITDRLMHQLQATYTRNKKLSFNALTSYTNFSRQVYSTLYYPNGDVRVATAQGLHSLTTFNGYVARATAVYKPSSVIAIQPGVDINIETGEGERIKQGSHNINDYAFFATADITPHSFIQIRPGIRFEKNSVYQAPPAIPSLNVKLAVAPSTDIRLAYAKGFRAPSLRELYYDFFDASHQIEGNPDLQAERSNSFTGSVNWKKQLNKNAMLSLIMNGFYNDVNNLIAYAAKANAPTVTSFINISKYKTRGGGFNGNLSYKNLTASLGFAYTGRYNEYMEEDKSLPEFKWSPEVNSFISYAFSAIGLDLNLYYKLTGKLPYYESVTTNNQTAYRLVQTAAYHWADFTVNKKVGKYIKLNAGVRNLFNVTAVNSTAVVSGSHSSAGAKAIGYGRSFFAGLIFDWHTR
ncbi:MAG: TonB-dependent receptor [Chitinophagaceae bacterium]|nr:TonB-dependent receptor [Chitinophagaceae bacterium]